MDDYVVTPFDEGGVHTNSNIHNKAAHNVLTATRVQATARSRPGRSTTSTTSR